MSLFGQSRPPSLRAFTFTPAASPKPIGNFLGVLIHERDAVTAEAMLERRGILPTLTAYLAGIGRAYR